MSGSVRDATTATIHGLLIYQLKKKFLGKYIMEANAGFTGIVGSIVEYTPSMIGHDNVVAVTVTKKQTAAIGRLHGTFGVERIRSDGRLENVVDITVSANEGDPFVVLDEVETDSRTFGLLKLR